MIVHVELSTLPGSVLTVGISGEEVCCSVLFGLWLVCLCLELYQEYVLIVFLICNNENYCTL